MKKKIFSLFLFSFLIFSCEVGLGELVDIDAPEITIGRMVAGDSVKTNFSTTLYTKQTVVFEGTATDNIAVTGVRAEVKWLGDADYSFLTNGSVSGGGIWKLEVSFPREGACWLKIVSEDKNKNYGAKSARVISLFVDENAPVGEAWYIDRCVGGIQYSLQSKEALEAIIEKDPSLSNPSNIDVAQNGEFKICSTFNDASGIASVKISIWDENEKLGEVENSAESNYAPQFLISEKTIPLLPSSEMHYLQVKYSASDIVTDPEENKVADAEISMGYFIWWPESDNPRRYISQEEEDGSIKLHVNDSINVVVFDDDGFLNSQEIICTLGDKEYKKKPADGERECNIIVNAPGEAQTMELRVTAKDKNGKPLDKTSSVLVTDDSHPTLIITSPENNQTPTVSGEKSDIVFNGFALDSSGCKSLKFIWVPDSVANKKDAALKWMNADSSSVPSSDVEVKSGTGEFAGLKLYNVKLSAATDEKGLKKQTFGFTRSLVNDFGDDKNKDKYFYVRLIRKDGNFTDSELKLAADNIKPEFNLINPSGNMAIIDEATPNLVLEFNAQKSTGVPMDTDKYKIEYIDPDGNATPLGGSYDKSRGAYRSAVIDEDTLKEFNASGKNPKYKFYAEDILGNKADGIYEFIISSLPQITSISSSAPALCKAGDDILINVSFSKPVSLSSTSKIKLKLANIKNNNTAVARTASYYSGSGSTTLVFKYTVQPGDSSDKLQVNNESNKGPIDGIEETTAHLKTLPDGENLQDKKTIKIDGVTPKVTNIVLSTDANKVDSKSYLNAGKTVTAAVTVDKKVTVQGTPVFKVGNLSLAWHSIAYRDTNSSIITFSKKITSDDENGEFTCAKNTCIESVSLDDIKDAAGNSLTNPLTGNTDTIVVDTDAPSKPKVKNAATDEDLKSGKYMNSVNFKIENFSQTSVSPVTTEYSLDGGSNWETLAENSKEITAASSVVNANLVVRIKDLAGNVSVYSDPISLEISNSFPSYTVECTNADKNYKSGKLTFKVYFASPVNIPASSAAYIALSGNDSNDVFGNAAHNAVITASSKGDNKSEAVFEYEIQRGDSFSLKVNKDDVKLLGITDQYGFTQNSLELAEDYVRPKLKCDTIPPKVSRMTPGGTKTTANGKNIYTNGKTIVLEFTENVKVNTGKIYLRQTAGWAIPPVFTASEFTKVLNAVKTAGNKGNDRLKGTQILYLDGLEDFEWLYGSAVGRANDRYHGTGQFAGPYKKSSHGLNGTKADTSTKYVLAYDLDIWGDGSAKFGITFDTNSSKHENLISETGKVVVKEGSNTISTEDIRQVLESVHFHERCLNVNSSSVSVSAAEKNKVTVNVPNGFLGDSDLPLGREWELVIEKGAFMDETGNLFGYEMDGTKTMSDSRQATNGATETSSEWKRERTSVDSTADVKPLVLIQDGANASFLSSGVAKPVIRVDRYSYGLGIYQPSENGSEITQSFINTETQNNKIVPAKPASKVRVRIDCETKDASVRYNLNTFEKTISDVTNENHAVEDGVNSYASSTAVTAPPAPANASTGTEYVKPFLSGSGDHKKSYIGIYSAKAFANNFSSAEEKEGVFQTVLCMVNPVDREYGSYYDKDSGYNDVSVRGTTGWFGEPSISPFPLRDSAVGSPYLRRAYPDYDEQNAKNYYWISYEIFVDSSCSIYAWGSTKSHNDWGRNWGLMKAGEFNSISGFRNWL